jgi:deoxycytidylate deaminase
LKRFVQFCDSLAELSTCKKRQVACVTFDPWFRGVGAVGYNGPPVGASNGSCPGREEQDQFDRCGCVHAEVNALVRMRPGPANIMYVTAAPCRHCAGVIVNSGLIKVVLWRDFSKNGEGLVVLNAADVLQYQVDDMFDERTMAGVRFHTMLLVAKGDKGC